MSDADTERGGGEEKLTAYLVTMRDCDAVVSAGRTPWEAVATVMAAFRADEDGWDGDHRDLEQLQELGEFVPPREPHP